MKFILFLYQAGWEGRDELAESPRSFEAADMPAALRKVAKAHDAATVESGQQSPVTKITIAVDQ